MHVDTKPFKSALTLLGKIAARRDVPALLVQAEETHLRLTAWSREQHLLVSTSIQGFGLESWRRTVNVTDAKKAARGSLLTLEPTDDGLAFKVGGLTTTIESPLDPETFPEHTPPGDVPVIATAALSELERVGKSVAPFVDPENTRYALGVVQLTIGPNGRSYCATDGRRLALYMPDRDFHREDALEILVPAPAFKLFKARRKVREFAHIRTADDRHMVTTGNMVVEWSRPNGRFPNYERILDDTLANAAAKVVMDRDDLLNALPDVTGAQDTSSVRVSAGLGLVELHTTLKYDCHELGKSDASLRVAVDGSSKTLVALRFLRDGLKACSPRDVRILLPNGSDSPAALQQGDFTYVFMPLSEDVVA